MDCNLRILTRGSTVDEAAAFFIAESACQAQLLAEAAAANGIPKKLVGDEEARFTKAASGKKVMHVQFQPEYKLIVKDSKGEVLQ